MSERTCSGRRETIPPLCAARSDAADRFVHLTEPLASLQQSCGGTAEDVIAIQDLLQLVQLSRKLNIRLARRMIAHSDDGIVTAWVQVSPADRAEQRGCDIAVLNWNVEPAQPHDSDEAAWRHAIFGQFRDLTAKLDRDQRIISAHANAPDLTGFVQRIGEHWTRAVKLPSDLAVADVPWQVLDAVRCRVPGSHRTFLTSLQPSNPADGQSGELHLQLLGMTPFSPDEPAQRDGRSINALNPTEAHDVLRAPVSRVIANADAMASRLAGPLPETYRGYAQDIASAGRHLLDLLEDFDVEAHIETFDDDQLVLTKLNLADIGRQAAQIMNERAADRKITIGEVTSAPFAVVMGDHRRCLQIILNLLANAIRFSPEGSHIRIAMDETDTNCSLKVTDEGPGIPETEHGKVFEKFERLGRTDGTGSGLGLYISRSLAEAMGGTLSLANEPDGAAAFTLALRKPSPN